MDQSRDKRCRVGRPTDEEDRRPYAVYRMFDAFGTLLYIGATADPAHRVYMHMVTDVTSYADFIQQYYATHAVEWHPTKAAARAAERKAIHDEAPLVNRQHNPKRWRRVDGQYALLPLESQPATDCRCTSHDAVSA